MKKVRKEEKETVVTDFKEIPNAVKAKKTGKAIKPAPIQGEVMAEEIVVGGMLPLEVISVPVDLPTTDPNYSKSLHTDGGKQFTPKQREEFHDLIVGINADMTDRKHLAEQLDRNTISLGGRLRYIFMKGYWRMDFHADQNQSFDSMFSDKQDREGFEAWTNYRLHFGIGHYDQLALAWQRQNLLLPAMQKHGIKPFRSESDTRKVWTDVYQPFFKMIRAELSATMTERQAEEYAEKLARDSVMFAWRRGREANEKENAKLRKEGKTPKMLTSNEAGKHATEAYKEALSQDEYKHLNKVLLPKLPAKRMVTSRKKTAGVKGTSPTDAKDNAASENKDAMNARSVPIVFVDQWKVISSVMERYKRIREAVASEKISDEKYFATITSANLNVLLTLNASLQALTNEMTRALSTLPASTTVRGQTVPTEVIPPQAAPKQPDAQPRKRGNVVRLSTGTPA